MRLSKRNRAFRKFLCYTIANFQVVGNVYAQSSPGLYFGQVPTAAQWNSYFAAKQDFPFVLGPGIQQNVPNIQTSNYTAQSSDCGKIIVASGGYFTITLPSIAGIQPNCVVTVYDGDSTRGKALSGFPADLNTTLWPLQSLQVGVLASNWVTLSNPGRWKFPSNETIFIDNTNGNDGNDGLASGAGGAIQTFGRLNTIITNQFDMQGHTLTASLATGTYTNSVVDYTNVGGGVVNINGNGSTLSGTATNSNALDVSVAPGVGALGVSIFSVQSASIICSNGAHGYFIRNGIGQIGTGLSFGTCGGGSQIWVDSPYSKMQLTNNYTITAGGGWHLTSAGGFIDYNDSTKTVSLTGTLTYTQQFAVAEFSGAIVSFNTWSGSAIGTRYSANTGGSISTNGGGPNFFPGNAPGLMQQGGHYDSPGTPSIASGFGGGSPNVSGTDMSGFVLMGTGAQTGGTINFTTANVPSACTIASSVALTSVTVNVSATQLVIGYGSITSPGSTVFYSCPQRVN
jgi:hypothetical protein